MKNLIGSSLADRYKLLSLLGSGAMGDVYLAEHVILGKKMAVKILKDDFCRHEEWVQRFQQEAIAASRIGHENIVNVTDFGRTPDGALYFVMEALDGVNLKTLIVREGQVPLARALPILSQVAKALGAAHAQGIVHRDLKAENVMICRRDDGSDFVKILDFGISKVTTVDDPGQPASNLGGKRLTRVGTLMGTPEYMAPEQAGGDATDHRTDVYAFGILSYEVVTGTVPFTAPSVMAILMKHLKDPPEAPSRRRPDLNLPLEFDYFVLHALSKDAAHRQQSMAEVRDEISRCMEAIGLPSISSGVHPVGGPKAPNPEPAEFAQTHVNFSVPGPRMPPLAHEPQSVVSQVAPPPQRSWGPAIFTLMAVAVLGGGGFAAARVLRPDLFTQPVAPPPPVAVVAPVVTPPPPAPPPVAPVEPVAAKPTPPPVVDPTPRIPPPVKNLNTKEIMSSAFAPVQSRLKGCFAANKDTLPSESGQMVIHFVVTPVGGVKDFKLMASGLEDSPLARCLATKMRSVHFPRNVDPNPVFDLPLEYGKMHE